MVAKLWVWPL